SPFKVRDNQRPFRTRPPILNINFLKEVAFFIKPVTMIGTI
ncbi:hypothetical protein CLOSYM_02286, partial [[Clostridium] symbiosum ATCC 14940]